MWNLSSSETIKVKQAFEQFAAPQGINVWQYHCDNGRFTDNAFANHCDQQRQSIIYCGIKAHFQNGIAEKASCNLQESARKQLLHAIACWPKAMHIALWPHTLRFAAHLHNMLPILDNKVSRLEKFTTIGVGVNLKHFHAFGCPVYALHGNLMSGSKVPKWSPRACIGLNLGPSPFHARNVNLILNLSTGLVSPQYHYKYDNFFETVRYTQPDIVPVHTWKQLAGLMRSNDTPTIDTRNSSTPTTLHDVTETLTDNPSHVQNGPQELAFDPGSAYETQDSATTAAPVSTQNEGAILPSATVQQDTTSTPPPINDTGTRTRCKQRKLSHAMQESITARFLWYL